MPIFLNRAQQVYTPDTYTVGATIPDGTQIARVKVSLTRVAWPVGPVGSVKLTFPDGDTAAFSFAGGVALDRQGNPLLESTVEFSRPGSLFPAGAYSIEFIALQTVTTAVKVERF